MNLSVNFIELHGKPKWGETLDYEIQKTVTYVLYVGPGSYAGCLRQQKRVG
ncbi:hypothetical protein J21TS7_08750 [Paenibacillus cineris]|uniref:Uncharacterized protein n=1 Tax=Paenibacillus cineris TaxID=237530 RepID=A0ABQ4L7U6_9BACL|nr:hypothetical protein J21TS7_08750 [Paenibacillus cineris]